MGRTKKAGKKTATKKAGITTSRPLVKGAAGNHAKARHMRDRRGHLHVWDGRLPTGLVAKPIVAQTKSKHRSYFEFVENTNKKKKLEFTVVKSPSLDRILLNALSPVNRSPRIENRLPATNSFLLATLH
jgi:hypothetical protein